MRIYKPKRKSKNGKTVDYDRWYIDFTDHLDRRQRWQGFANKKLTESIGRNLEELVRYKIAQQQPNPSLIRWLETIPETLRKKLVKSSILDIRQASGNQTLSSHIKDFKAYLLAKGNDSEYVETVLSRLNRIIQDCRFMTWTDVSASRVLHCLSELQGQHKKGKRIVEGIGSQTYNFYLQAIKQFCRWMCKDRRASESPVAHLDKISSHKVKNNRKRNRRVLDVKDFKHLLATTIDQPTRYGLTGLIAMGLHLFHTQLGQPTYPTILVITVFGSAAIWLPVTFLTRPTETGRLIQFYKQVRPFGFWKPIAEKCPKTITGRFMPPLLSWIGGSVWLIGLTLAIGKFLLLAHTEGWICLTVSTGGFVVMILVEMFAHRPYAEQK